MQSPVEYGSYPSNLNARRQCLASETVKLGERSHREYFLTHSTAGYESAGSMARWTNEFWSVTFDADGATHGRRFKTLAEAQALFDKWTSP